MMPSSQHPSSSSSTAHRAPSLTWPKRNAAGTRAESSRQAETFLAERMWAWRGGGLPHEEPIVLEVQDVLNLAGRGCFTAGLFVATGLAWLADAAWESTVVLVLPRLEAEFDLDSATAGLLISTMWIGQSVGTSAFGCFADTHGRRSAHLFSLLCEVVGGLIAACAPDAVVFAIGVFIVGLGVGGNLPVASALFAELSSQQSRGRYMTMLAFNWSFGAIAVAAASWAFIPAYSCGSASRPYVACNIGWRLVTVLTALLSTVAVAAACWIPETPSFLVSIRNNPVAALEVVRRIARGNGSSKVLEWLATGRAAIQPRISSSSSARISSSQGSRGRPTPNGYGSLEGDEGAPRPASRMCCAESAGDDQADERRRCTRCRRCCCCCCCFEAPVAAVREVRMCWRRASTALRVTTGLLAVMWLMANFGYGLYNSFLPQLLTDKGIFDANGSGTVAPSSSGGNSQTGLLNATSTTTDPRNSDSGSAVYKDALIYSAAGLPGTLLGAWLIETFLGRRLTIALCAALMGLSLGVFDWCVHDELQAVLAISFFNCLAQPLFSTLYVYTVEVAPTRVRGTIVGFCSLCGRLSSVVAPALTGYLLKQGLSSYHSFIGIGSVALVVLAAVVLPIETRGRALASSS